MTARRVLTVRQPWASLIMAGVKDVENRSWPVPSTLLCRCMNLWCDQRRSAEHNPFPVPLWIHAGMGWDPAGHEAVARAEDEGRIPAQGFGDLPSGALLGPVTCIGCHWADDCWKWNPIAPGAGEGGKPIAKDGERPGWCSRWADPDCYHWTLTDPQPLADPIPLRGRQGLWTLPEALVIPCG